VAITLGTQLYVVVSSTLLTVLGPTMGLVGPRGSMHVAVKGLYSERSIIWLMFGGGLGSFFMATMCYIWIVIHEVLTATICSAIVFILLCWTFYSCTRILRTFEFKNETEHLSGPEYMKQKAAAQKDAAKRNPQGSLALQSTRQGAVI
jgi:hypothetical protein